VPLDTLRPSDAFRCRCSDVSFLLLRTASPIAIPTTTKAAAPIRSPFPEVSDDLFAVEDSGTSGFGAILVGASPATALFRAGEVKVGLAIGRLLGAVVGPAVGGFVGEVVGFAAGGFVGEAVGLVVGRVLGE
jgi:hypothetical protein